MKKRKQKDSGLSEKKRDGRRRGPGAKPDRLTLYNALTFSEAIKRAVQKKKPAEGWPKRERRVYRKKKPSDS